MAVTLMWYWPGPFRVKKFQNLKSCDNVCSENKFMTDSTLNANSGDGGPDVGGVDELFGELAEEAAEQGSTQRDGNAADPTEPADSASDAVEDQTAAAVFGQLQETVADTDDVDAVDDVLADETPEDIIASADEPASDPVDDTLVDEGALENLLLTDRTQDQEFLWIDTDDGTVDETASDTLESDPEDGEADDTDHETDAATDASAALEADAESEAADATDRPSNAESEAAESPTELFGDDFGTPDSSDTGADEDTEASADDTADDTADPSEDTDETSLAPVEGSDVPATVEDDSSSGLLGWLRSKLGGLF